MAMPMAMMHGPSAACRGTRSEGGGRGTRTCARTALALLLLALAGVAAGLENHLARSLGPALAPTLGCRALPTHSGTVHCGLGQGGAHKRARHRIHQYR